MMWKRNKISKDRSVPCCTVRVTDIMNLTIVFMLFNFMVVAVNGVDSQISSETIESKFASSLIASYGSSGSLNVGELSKLLGDLASTEKPKIQTSSCNASIDIVSQPKCYMSKCLSAQEIFTLHSLNHSVNSLQLTKISTTILHTAQNAACGNQTSHEKNKHGKSPSQSEVWGYGFLFVTIISVGSLLGVVFMPFMQKKYYEAILMFMVALAVGSLVGSGLLFLIPDALGLNELFEDPRQYIFKCTTVMGGIYLFFLVERFLKTVMDFRQKKKGKKTEYNLPICSIHTQTHLDTDPHLKVPPTLHANHDGKPSCSGTCIVSNHSVTTMDQLLISESQPLQNEEIVNSQSKNGNEKNEENGVVINSVKNSSEKQEIAPVAWMIIFGDGLHNFIDGLSIGAAFSQRILTGVSISLAVICEELPHELGDFAILLNSGMTIRQAVFYNLMSACTCYLGLIIGIILGENTSLNTWIFAVAGGMFLYISLVDMMPEVNHASESVENMKTMGKCKIWLIQNLGLLTGYGIMMIMALYGGNINF